MLKRISGALLLVGITISGPAQAYIGPGAGLGAIAVAIALALGVLLLVVGLFWYPLKRVLKARKGEDPRSGSTD